MHSLPNFRSVDKSHEMPFDKVAEPELLRAFQRLFDEGILTDLKIANTCKVILKKDTGCTTFRSELSTSMLGGSGFTVS